MNKKMKVILLIVFFIVGLSMFSFVHSRVSSGNKIYGDGYCNTNHYLESAGDAFTNWTCGLCGKTATNPDTKVPKICNMCSLFTGRCDQCGKLEK